MTNITNALISAPMAALSRYMAMALRYRLPPEVAENGKHLILDTLAAMVSGGRGAIRTGGRGRHAGDDDLAAAGGPL